MLRRFCFVGLVGAVLLCVVGPTEAVTRVGKKFSVLEIGAGYASPVGKYDDFGGESFVDENGIFHQLNADEVFNPSFSIAASLGQLRNRWLVSVGAVYTKVNQLDTIVVGGLGYVFPDASAIVFSNFNQFDLRLNVNYQFLDISTNQFTPYAGVGLAAGMISETAPGYSTEYDVNTLLSANFGVEFKIWSSADKRKFVTLASVNGYDLLSSGYRPRNLNIGGAIKMYVRP
jgi:hypothetical protein